MKVRSEYEREHGVVDAEGNYSARQDLSGYKQWFHTENRFRTIPCQCEHYTHKPHPCYGVSTQIWQTIYGSFVVCTNCDSFHKPPDRYIDTGSRSEYINDEGY